MIELLRYFGLPVGISGVSGRIDELSLLERGGISGEDKFSSQIRSISKASY